MNIAYVNLKGGVGKTTACIVTALGLQEHKQAVELQDIDPQGTATQWWATAFPTPLEPDGRIVLVDTPPRIDSPGWKKAVTEADLCVAVTSPSPADVITTKVTLSKLQELNVRTVILFNQVMPQTILARELPELVKSLGAPALRSFLHRRQAYQHAVLEGWSALPHVAKQEVQELILELLTLKSS